MSTHKIILAAAIMMLIANLVLVGIILIPKLTSNDRSSGPPPKAGGAQEHFELSDDQTVEFERLAQEQRRTIDRLNSTQRELIKSYFISDQTATQDSTLAQIQELETDKLLATKNHLQDIKSLLREDQKQHFDEFVTHLMGSSRRPDDRRRPPPPRRH